MTYPNVASLTSETSTVDKGIIGTSDLVNQRATIVSGAGTIAMYQVLGTITASGKLTKHNPGASNGSEVATAIAAIPVDATSGDVLTQVYTAGEFDMDALAYHASTDTDAEKLALFGLSSAIKIKKAAYGSI